MMLQQTHEHELSFVQKYIFSGDHKVIGKQFFFTALFFYLIGGTLALGVRYQLAWPGTSVPILGSIFGWQDGVMPSEGYNMLFTMHATVMIFLVIIPMLVGAFGNYVVPLQIGARDMAFPVLNMLSYWMMWPSFILLMASFFVRGGAAQAISHSPIFVGLNQTGIGLPGTTSCLIR